MTVKEIYHLVRTRIKSSDIATRMANGAFWSFTGTATAKAIVMIAGIICARILGKELYGQYGLVKVTLNTFIVLGGAGLGVTATKYISEYLRSQKSRVPSIYLLTNGFAAIMAILMFLLVYFSAGFLANNILNTPSLESTMRLTAFILIVLVVNTAQDGVLSGFEDFRAKAISAFIGSIFQTVLIISLAYYGGLNGAVLGYGLGFCISAIFNKIFINRNFKIHEIKQELSAIRMGDIKIIYRFTLPAVMSSFLIVPVYFMIRILIKRYVDFSGMADYDVGDQWRLLILFVPTSICAIVLPILSSISNDEKPKFWKVLNLNILLNGAVTALIALLVIAFSGIILSFYGPDYNNPFPLIVLSITCIFISIAAVVGNAIVSLGYMWTSLLFNLIWASIVLTLTYLLLENGHGVNGVAIAMLISYVISFVAQYSYLRITHREKQ